MGNRETFGILPDGQSVEVITLDNTGGMQLRVITYGCVIVGLRAPDRHGRVANVVLGYDTLERYVAESPYYGAVIGRYANRISSGGGVLTGRRAIRGISTRRSPTRSRTATSCTSNTRP